MSSIICPRIFGAICSKWWTPWPRTSKSIPTKSSTRTSKSTSKRPNNTSRECSTNSNPPCKRKSIEKSRTSRPSWKRISGNSSEKTRTGSLTTGRRCSHKKSRICTKTSVMKCPKCWKSWKSCRSVFRGLIRLRRNRWVGRGYKKILGRRICLERRGTIMWGNNLINWWLKSTRERTGFRWEKWLYLF